MKLMSTAPSSDPFNTGYFDTNQTEDKNIKINQVLCSIMPVEKTTSCSGLWKSDDFVSCKLPNTNDLGGASQTHWWAINSDYENYTNGIENLIYAYMSENSDLNDDFKDLLLKEYSCFDEINTLHSLIAISQELFKESRPRNEIESKIINDFVRSKSKIISSKKI